MDDLAANIDYSNVSERNLRLARHEVGKYLFRLEGWDPDHKDYNTKLTAAKLQKIQNELKKFDKPEEHLKEELPDETNSDTLDTTQTDVKNPAETLSRLAKIDEVKAQKFLSDLPLTDYVALCIAMEDKDLPKISAIVGKHKLAEDQYHEAIDLKVAQELRKISQQSPHQGVAANTTTNAANTPNAVNNMAAQSTAPSASTAGTLGMTGMVAPVGSVGAVGTAGTVSPTSPKPGTPATPALAVNNIVDADSKTDTVALKNPQTHKVEIKNVKDPKNNAQIMALIKNAGL